MINLPLSDVRIFLCTTPIKMQSSFDTLMGLTQTVFDQDPLSGHLFLFFNRDRNRVKILFWDQDGLCIWYKRLEAGTFQFPAATHEEQGIEMDYVQLTESNTGVSITDVYVDKGYRGHNYQGGATVHLAGSSHRGLSRTHRKRRRRRSAVEPLIGHMKSDDRLGRCFLRGLLGDEINALLAAAGQNLRKLLRRFVFALLFRLSRLAGAAIDAGCPSNPAPIAA